MEKFANTTLRLNKGVKKGDKESLLSLLSVPERFKHIEVLTNADEGTSIKVVLEGWGEVDLKLGADMEKGQQKTIMTLFGYSERAKPIDIEKNAEVGESITVTMWKI